MFFFFSHSFSKHKPFWIELSRGWVTTITRQVARGHLNEMLILIRSDFRKENSLCNRLRGGDMTFIVVVQRNH